MDPILATVIGGVLWFFIGGFIGGIIYIAFALTGGALASSTDHARWALLIPIGWFLAAIWWIWVMIQVILHGIRLVQLLTGSPVTV